MSENPAELEEWLYWSMLGLTDESKARVRSEIETHYWDAVEDYQKEGKTQEQASRLAILSLGDHESARLNFNRSYLTHDDLKTIKQFKGESAERIHCLNNLDVRKRQPPWVAFPASAHFRRYFSQKYPLRKAILVTTLLESSVLSMAAVLGAASARCIYFGPSSIQPATCLVQFAITWPFLETFRYFRLRRLLLKLSNQEHLDNGQ